MISNQLIIELDEAILRRKDRENFRAVIDQFAEELERGNKKPTEIKTSQSAAPHDPSIDGMTLSG
jgi:hypothetical protein